MQSPILKFLVLLLVKQILQQQRRTAIQDVAVPRGKNTFLAKPPVVTVMFDDVDVHTLGKLQKMFPWLQPSWQECLAYKFSHGDEAFIGGKLAQKIHSKLLGIKPTPKPESIDIYIHKFGLDLQIFQTDKVIEVYPSGNVLVTYHYFTGSPINYHSFGAL